MGSGRRRKVNKAVAALSKLLEPAEREFVCGDLEELRLNAPAAAANILGLVIRRQLSQWLCWGPWLALLGVGGLAGLFLSVSLSRLGTGLFLQIRTYSTYGVAYEPGGVSTARQIAYIATSIVALLLWSWACGFVLVSLSRRVLWTTSGFFYIVVRDSWFVRLALAGNIHLNHSLAAAILVRLLPLDPMTILFLLALVLGIRSATKATLKKNTWIVITAAGVISVILLSWMGTWFAAGFARWSGQAYQPAPFVSELLPRVACAWPVFVLPLLRNRLASRQAEIERTA